MYMYERSESNEKLTANKHRAVDKLLCMQGPLKLSREEVGWRSWRVNVRKKERKERKKKKKTENEVNEKQNILFLQVLSFFLGFCGKHLEEASHVVLSAKNNSDSPWAVSYRYVNT